MKHLLNPIVTSLERFKIAQSYRRASSHQKRFDFDGLLTDTVARYPNVTERYYYFHHLFHHGVPTSLRDHRRYFKQNQRGFGEDAFHAMWWQLLRQFRPRQCLEIGVYRGQTLSLWSLIARESEMKISVTGISPFTHAGDAVSTYLDNLDYRADVLASFAHFGLPKPRLLKALSTDPKAQALIESKYWDLIYIDGSHDYEVVLADYRLCRKQLAPGGIIVFDDAGLDTGYLPLPFSFSGHPDPSRVVKKYVSREMTEIAQVGHNRVFQNNRRRGG